MALHKSNLDRGHDRRPLLYLRELWVDLRLLFAAELPNAASIPPRENFADARAHGAAVQESKRRHQLAVLRQALEKQEIRETLFPRLRSAVLLAAPVTFPLFMLVATIWVTGIMENHQLWGCLALNFCAFHIEGWYNHRPHSSRSPFGEDRLVGIHAAPSHCRDRQGRPAVANPTLMRPNMLAPGPTDEEMDTLFAEVSRCRLRWRLWCYSCLILVLSVAALTLWLMPYAAHHRSPFG